ncbi:hypothetical protein F5880DRAFT_1612900 [Lentinula raphanica]|nr:hypothetical protein F5880DRAFT_1612900 [Lentinula raphanica]
MGYAIYHLNISWDTNSPPIFPSDLSRIQKNLSNLRILHWRNTWSDIPDAFKSLVSGLNIETLIISEVLFQSTIELVQMTAMLPSTLKSIDVGRIGFTHDNSDIEGVNNALGNNPLAKRKRIHLHTLHSFSTESAQNLFRSLISLNMITIDRFIIDVDYYYPDREDLEDSNIPWLNEMLLKYGSIFSEVIYKLPAAELGSSMYLILSLQHCTNLRTLHIQNVYLGFSMENCQGPLHVTTSAIQQLISSLPNPEILEEINIRFVVELTVKAAVVASHSSTTDVPIDHVSLIVNQLARFDWNEFARFLLDTSFPPGQNHPTSSTVKTLSYPTSLSRCTSFSTSRPEHSFRRRLHIQIGAYEFIMDHATRDVFAKEHDRYVQYIYDNGLKNLLERGGLDELVFSQDHYEYQDLYAAPSAAAEYFNSRPCEYGNIPFLIALEKT